MSSLIYLLSLSILIFPLSFYVFSAFCLFSPLFIFSSISMLSFLFSPSLCFLCSLSLLSFLSFLSLYTLIASPVFLLPRVIRNYKNLIKFASSKGSSISFLKYLHQKELVAYFWPLIDNVPKISVTALSL